MWGTGAGQGSRGPYMDFIDAIARLCPPVCGHVAARNAHQTPTCRHQGIQERQAGWNCSPSPFRTRDSVHNPLGWGQGTGPSPCETIFRFPGRGNAQRRTGRPSSARWQIWGHPFKVGVVTHWHPPTEAASKHGWNASKLTRNRVHCSRVCRRKWRLRLRTRKLSSVSLTSKAVGLLPCPILALLHYCFECHDLPGKSKPDSVNGEKVSRRATGRQLVGRDIQTVEGGFCPQD